MRLTAGSNNFFANFEKIENKLLEIFENRFKFGKIWMHIHSIFYRPISRSQIIIEFQYHNENLLKHLFDSCRLAIQKTPSKDKHKY